MERSSSVILSNLTGLMSWTKLAEKNLKTNCLVSLDFWNTVCIRKKTSVHIRRLVCRELVERFDLNCDENTLYDTFLEVADGLRTINRSLHFDGEYKLEVCWYYVSILLHRSDAKSQEFANYAIEYEINLAYRNSQIPRLVRELLKNSSHLDNLFIVSDFEGNEEYLRRIIKLHGLSLPRQIWVSSDKRYSKHSGAIFREIRIKHNKFEDFLHIGDDKVADLKNPREFGFRSRITSQIRGKANLIPVKIWRYWRIIPSSLSVTFLPIGVERYEKFLTKLSYTWAKGITRLLETLERTKVSIAYVGSEGAFASNFDINRSCGREICINFGRRTGLKANVIDNPQWVVSRLLLERFSLQEMCDFLIHRHDEIELHSLHNAIEDRRIHEFVSTRSSQDELLIRDRDIIRQVFPSREDSIVVVDIGYKSTFASSLVALGYKDVYVAQLFSKSISKLSVNPKSQFGYMVGSTRRLIQLNLDAELLETIFAMGPRAPRVSKRMMYLRHKLINVSSNTGLFLGEYLMTRISMQKFLRFPAREFVYEIQETKWPEDDLRSKKYYFQKLPWNQKAHKGRFRQHTHLILSYLRSRYKKS